MICFTSIKLRKFGPIFAVNIVQNGEALHAVNCLLLDVTLPTNKPNIG